MYLLKLLRSDCESHDFIKIVDVFNSRFDVRMVLEPKFADYGSIHSIGEATAVPTQQPQQQTTDGDINAQLNGVGGGALANNHLEAAITMTQGDLYQRQPLLTPDKGDKWGHGSHPIAAKEYFINTDDDVEAMGDTMLNQKNTQTSNGVIKINIPSPIRDEPHFPQERWKTLVAFVIMFCSSLCVLISLATVHERVPDRKTYGPLPDVFFELMKPYDWGLDISEYLIILAFNSAVVVIALHKHRFILARRLFLIMSLLYVYRAVTMFVTVLPVSSTTYYCSPKNNHTSTLDMAKRVVHMLSGMGLSINGKQTYCGDFIYSGHTLTLVISYLFIAEYTPKKLYLVHWFYWLVAVMGIFMLQLSRSHYSIDVIIAYFVTTRTFWVYHTLANNSSLKQHSEKNLLCRLWWYKLFLYFEGNIEGQVPRKWPDWPFPWPRRFQQKSRDS